MPNIKDAADMTPQSHWEATVDEAVRSLNALNSRAKAVDRSLAQAADAFSEFFQGQWSRIAQEPGSAELAARDTARMGNALEDIAASILGVATAPSGSLAKGDALGATRQRYEEKEPIQVLPFRFDATDQIRFADIKQAPEIENLALRGGGAEGVGYPPALVELAKHDGITGVKQVVGASAGALTAALLAAGLNAEQFKKVSDVHDMASLKGKPPNWDDKYPNLKFGMTGFHGGTAMELVDRESAQSIKAFLDSGDGQAKIAAAVGDGRISVADAHALDGLRHQNFEIDRTPQMVTFQDLENLSKIDPGKFKSLTLTGWNCTDGTLAHFNAKATPRMPIAIASRISMSIPYFFKSPKYDVGQGEKSWVGGGVGSNMPAGAILDDLEHARKCASADLDDPEMTAQAHELMDTRSRTLFLTFHEQGNADEIQPGSSPEPRAGGRATNGVFANPVSGGANSLSPEQRAAFLRAGPPNPQVFANSEGVVDGRLYQAAVQFYQEAARLDKPS
jgi:predicted acylesterase/phospholipase RssA